MSIFGRFESSFPGDENDGNQPLSVIFVGLRNRFFSCPGWSRVSPPGEAIRFLRQASGQFHSFSN